MNCYHHHFAQSSQKNWAFGIATLYDITQIASVKPVTSVFTGSSLHPDSKENRGGGVLFMTWSTSESAVIMYRFTVPTVAFISPGTIHYLSDVLEMCALPYY